MLIVASAERRDPGFGDGWPMKGYATFGLRMTISKATLIQVKYACSVLRVAQGADVDVAVRLIEGLAMDFPTSDVDADVAKLHLAAIASYRKLASALREKPRDTGSEWRAAQAATDHWAAMFE